MKSETHDLISELWDLLDIAQQVHKMFSFVKPSLKVYKNFMQDILDGQIHFVVKYKGMHITIVYFVDDFKDWKIIRSKNFFYRVIKTFFGDAPYYDLTEEEVFVAFLKLLILKVEKYINNSLTDYPLYIVNNFANRLELFKVLMMLSYCKDTYPKVEIDWFQLVQDIIRKIDKDKRR